MDFCMQQGILSELLQGKELQGENTNCEGDCTEKTRIVKERNCKRENMNCGGRTCRWNTNCEGTELQEENTDCEGKE